MPPSTRRLSPSRRWFLATIASLISTRPVAEAQPVVDAKELATYRLTAAVFKRFAHATRLMAPVLREDPRFAREPLITKEIAVSGDAPEMARALEQRLHGDPALSGPLFAADISAREYATFAIALVGAHLAHGFVKSGAMRRVPNGVAAENVEFVDGHAAEISTLFKHLGLD